MEALDGGRDASMTGGMMAPEREELSTRMRFKRQKVTDEQNYRRRRSCLPWRRSRGSLPPCWIKYLFLKGLPNRGEASHNGPPPTR